MLRAPEGARAELHPALEPADDLALGEQRRRRGRAARPRRRSAGTARRCRSRNRATSLGREARARAGCPAGRRGRRAGAGLSSSWCQTNSAAPSAPPASPAAGWIQMSSNGPSRSSRPLATQFSATPPARTRFFMPGLLAARARPMRSTTSSVTAWMLAARSMCRCSSGDSGLPRRPAEERVEPAAGHRQPLAVVEVVHVQPEAAVGLEVDQVLEDQRRGRSGWP